VLLLVQVFRVLSRAPATLARCSSVATQTSPALSMANESWSSRPEIPWSDLLRLTHAGPLKL
jgi:hypothetical protein